MLTLSPLLDVERIRALLGYGNPVAFGFVILVVGPDDEE